MLGPWLGIAESIAENWGSQVIGLSFREGSLSLVAANGPARARRLEYDPGRGWTTSEGAARAWERAAFFSEDARVAALNRAGGWLRAWKARQAIVAAYELDEVQVGSLQPAPPADVVERVLSSLEIKRSVLKRIPLWLPPGPHVEIVEPLDSSFPENLRRAWIGLRLPVASVAAREPSTVNVNREQALARLFAVNQSASVAFQLERFRLPGTNEEISFRAEQCRLLAPPSAAP